MLHTSGQNDADTVKIDVCLFKKHYLSFNRKLISDSLYKKKQDIYNNNNCFHITFEKDNYSQGHRQNYNAKSYSTVVQHNTQTTNNTQNIPSTVSKNQNRLYIITSDFTEDSKIKKQFMSHLNKLTENNRNSIYPKIKDLVTTISAIELQEAIYTMVWDFIKKTPHDIYISLLQFFDDKMTSNYIELYINAKQWYPPNYAFDNNLLTADNGLYDMYCDYVKWKLYVTNTIKVICTLYKQDTKLIDKLLDDIYHLFFEHMFQPITRHIVHFALEQIHNINKIHKNKDIIDKLKIIDTKELESSSKFLIMDILSE